MAYRLEFIGKERSDHILCRSRENRLLQILFPAHVSKASAVSLTGSADSVCSFLSAKSKSPVANTQDRERGFRYQYQRLGERSRKRCNIELKAPERLSNESVSALANNGLSTGNFVKIEIVEFRMRPKRRTSPQQRPRLRRFRNRLRRPRTCNWRKIDLLLACPDN